MEETSTPTLTWELGTAYDLFISLVVLHKPEEFGLRGSWAAGVRSRIPPKERKVLEEAILFTYAPLPWIHSLPEPKDSATALWTLGKLPPAERLAALTLCCGEPDPIGERLKEVAGRRSWDEKDLEALRAAFQAKKHHQASKELPTILDWWARPDEFGDQYLEALRTYHQVFFAEEEEHILPALKASLLRAQELSTKLAAPDLVEDLSQGLRFTWLAGLSELVLAPSYWCTPLVMFDDIGERRMLMTFGARPADASLIPGESVPDALLRALKALADPTRLRILRYLAAEALTPAELSRRLRLRPPTVVHHLSDLRLAGLVYVHVDEGGEKHYAVRAEMIKDTFTILEDFLALSEK